MADGYADGDDGTGAAGAGRKLIAECGSYLPGAGRAGVVLLCE